MLIILMSYIILNLYVLLKKMKNKGAGIDENDPEAIEKDARFREKVERFTHKLNALIFAILRVVAWILSAVFTVAIIILFVALYYVIFEPQALNSASLFGLDAMLQYAYQYTPQTIIYGLAIAAVLLISITYLIVVFLLKRRPNKWLILGLATLCIALIVCAITDDNVSITPRENIGSIEQTTECIDTEIKSEK